MYISVNIDEIQKKVGGGDKTFSVSEVFDGVHHDCPLIENIESSIGYFKVHEDIINKGTADLDADNARKLQFENAVSHFITTRMCIPSSSFSLAYDTDDKLTVTFKSYKTHMRDGFSTYPDLPFLSFRERGLSPLRKDMMGATALNMKDTYINLSRLTDMVVEDRKYISTNCLPTGEGKTTGVCLDFLKPDSKFLSFARQSTDVKNQAYDDHTGRGALFLAAPLKVILEPGDKVITEAWLNNVFIAMLRARGDLFPTINDATNRNLESWIRKEYSDQHAETARSALSKLNKEAFPVILMLDESYETIDIGTLYEMAGASCRALIKKTGENTDTDEVSDFFKNINPGVKKNVVKSDGNDTPEEADVDDISRDINGDKVSLDDTDPLYFLKQFNLYSTFRKQIKDIAQKLPGNTKNKDNEINDVISELVEVFFQNMTGAATYIFHQLFIVYRNGKTPTFRNFHEVSYIMRQVFSNNKYRDEQILLNFLWNILPVDMLQYRKGMILVTDDKAKKNVSLITIHKRGSDKSEEGKESEDADEGEDEIAGKKGEVFTSDTIGKTHFKNIFSMLANAGKIRIPQGNEKRKLKSYQQMFRTSMPDIEQEMSCGNTNIGDDIRRVCNHFMYPPAQKKDLFLKDIPVILAIDELHIAKEKFEEERLIQFIGPSKQKQKRQRNSGQSEEENAYDTLSEFLSNSVSCIENSNRYNDEWKERRKNNEENDSVENFIEYLTVLSAEKMVYAIRKHLPNLITLTGKSLESRQDLDSEELAISESVAQDILRILNGKLIHPTNKVRLCALPSEKEVIDILSVSHMLVSSMNPGNKRSLETIKLDLGKPYDANGIPLKGEGFIVLTRSVPKGHLSITLYDFFALALHAYRILGEAYKDLSKNTEAKEEFHSKKNKEVAAYKITESAMRRANKHHLFLKNFGEKPFDDAMQFNDIFVWFAQKAILSITARTVEKGLFADRYVPLDFSIFFNDISLEADIFRCAIQTNVHCLFLSATMDISDAHTINHSLDRLIRLHNGILGKDKEGARKGKVEIFNIAQKMANEAHFVANKRMSYILSEQPESEGWSNPTCDKYTSPYLDNPVEVSNIKVWSVKNGKDEWSNASVKVDKAIAVNMEEAGDNTRPRKLVASELDKEKTVSVVAETLSKKAISIAKGIISLQRAMGDNKESRYHCNETFRALFFGITEAGTGRNTLVITSSNAIVNVMGRLGQVLDTGESKGRKKDSYKDKRFLEAVNEEKKLSELILHLRNGSIKPPSTKPNENNNEKKIPKRILERFYRLVDVLSTKNKGKVALIPTCREYNRERVTIVMVVADAEMIKDPFFRDALSYEAGVQSVLVLSSDRSIGVGANPILSETNSSWKSSDGEENVNIPQGNDIYTARDFSTIAVSGFPYYSPVYDKENKWNIPGNHHVVHDNLLRTLQDGVTLSDNRLSLLDMDVKRRLAIEHISQQVSALIQQAGRIERCNYPGFGRRIVFIGDNDYDVGFLYTEVFALLEKHNKRHYHESYVGDVTIGDERISPFESRKRVMSINSQSIFLFIEHMKNAVKITREAKDLLDGKFNGDTGVMQKAKAFFDPDTPSETAPFLSYEAALKKIRQKDFRAAWIIPFNKAFRKCVSAADILALPETFRDYCKAYNEDIELVSGNDPLNIDSDLMNGISEETINAVVRKIKGLSFSLVPDEDDWEEQGEKALLKLELQEARLYLSSNGEIGDIESMESHAHEISNMNMFGLGEANLPHQTSEGNNTVHKDFGNRPMDKVSQKRLNIGKEAACNFVFFNNDYNGGEKGDSPLFRKKEILLPRGTGVNIKGNIGEEILKRIITRLSQDSDGEVYDIDEFLEMKVREMSADHPDLMQKYIEFQAESLERCDIGYINIRTGTVKLFDAKNFTRSSQIASLSKSNFERAPAKKAIMTRLLKDIFAQIDIEIADVDYYIVNTGLTNGDTPEIIEYVSEDGTSGNGSIKLLSAFSFVSVYGPNPTFYGVSEKLYDIIVNELVAKSGE